VIERNGEMTAQATDALVDAIEASYGLPVPTPAEFATRIEEQLHRLGFMLVQVRPDKAVRRIVTGVVYCGACAQVEGDPHAKWCERIDGWGS
jgi:hypothetical protein